MDKARPTFLTDFIWNIADDVLCGIYVRGRYFRSREFDFTLANPPYGKKWKSDFECDTGIATYVWVLSNRKLPDIAMEDPQELGAIELEEAEDLEEPVAAN
jgi:hypothetical protein